MPGPQAACNAAATPPADPRNPRGSRTSGTHTEESVVPLINVKVIEGVFDSEQKQQIVRSLTEAMVAIEGENMRSVTWCVVEEVDSGDWGIGGKPVTTSDVKALATGVPVG
jgi:4-oxalocrotonate tautomerase